MDRRRLVSNRKDQRTSRLRLARREDRVLSQSGRRSEFPQIEIFITAARTDIADRVREFPSGRQLSDGPTAVTPIGPVQEHSQLAQHRVDE